MPKFLSRKVLLAILAVLIIGVFVFVLENGSFSGEGEKTTSATVKKDQYFPINKTVMAKYIYPNRPFDCKVTIEGVGWKDGKFTAVMKVSSLLEGEYSDLQKFFSPIATYKGKDYILGNRVWVEGSLNPYRTVPSRYAASTLSAAIPIGEWPDKLKVNGIEIPLPKRAEVSAFPALTPLIKNADNLNKGFKTKDAEYTIQSLEAGKKGTAVKLNVHSKVKDLKENYFFLIKDDKERLYSFLKSSLPSYYEKGDNSVELKLEQPVAADAEKLSLIVFKGKSIQSHLYEISNEKEILFYEN